MDIKIPFQDSFTPKSERTDERGKKKRSAVNYIKDAKDIYDKAKKIVQIAQWLSNPVTLSILIFFGIMIVVTPAFFSPTTGSALIGGGTQPSPTLSPDQEIPPIPVIPGFGVELEGPESINNGESLEYRVIISYDPDVATVPLESIELYSTLPTGTTYNQSSSTGNPTDPTGSTLTWPLSDAVNRLGFKIVLTPDVKDTIIIFTINARTTISPTGGSSGNACTEPFEGTGYCSVESLTPIFGDPTNALIASMICQGESRSNPFANSLDNLPCPPDYSIGLFQINQLAHCSTAFSNPQSCTIGDQALLNACVTRFKDPQENINYAHQLFLSGGTGWTVNKWGAYANVQKKLQECNIL